VPWPAVSTTRIDSTTPQLAQLADALANGRGRAPLFSVGVAPGFTPRSPPDVADGIQPIMVAIPTTLNTISVIAAMTITG
jgi:hypothetical protein